MAASGIIKSCADRQGVYLDGRTAPRTAAMDTFR